MWGLPAKRCISVLLPLALILMSACGDSGRDEASTELRVLGSDAQLAALALSSGALDQIFQASQPDYTSAQAFLVESIQVIPTAADSGATIMIAGNPVTSGQPSSPIPLAVGEETLIGIEVTAADGIDARTYTVAVARESVAEFAQRAYVKASNSGAGDWFGYSVALSGDTLAVGAYQEAGAVGGIVRGSPDDGQAGDGAPFSGAVYVFVRDESGAWSQQAYIKGVRTRTGTFDNFGASVALSGDTLAVGAPFENSAATGVTLPGRIRSIETGDVAVDSGAVYVFVRDGLGNWSQQAYIKASNTGENDAFGLSVALWGDTLAVGAVNEDGSVSGILRGGPGSAETGDGLPDSGAVYMFARDGAGNWSQQAYIKASNAGADDWFGWSVALWGDTLVVGALNESSALTGILAGSPSNLETGDGAGLSGAVYVFARDGAGDWSQQAYIKASNTGENDWFGWSVALWADGLAVGAASEDGAAAGVISGSPGNADTGDGAVDSGAVYVFTRDGTGGWNQQAYIKASNPGEDDFFGWSVALWQDRLAVGAVWEDGAAARILSGSPGHDATGDDAFNSGAVYVFARDGLGNWSQQAYVKASNTGDFDEFGYSVALLDDALAVGAPFEAGAVSGVVFGSPASDETGDGATTSGAVYVFR